MFYILLILGLSCLCFLWRMKSRKEQILEPPELPGKLPLVGHGNSFLVDGIAMFNDVIVKISNECLKNDGIIKFYFGTMTNYGVTDPDDCLTIANACIEKHYISNVLKPLTGKGLLNGDVHTWTNLRKLLSPAFNQSILDGFIEIFNTYALNLTDQFANEIGKEFNHDEILRKNSLETICATAIGVDSNEFGSYLKQYVPRFEEVLRIFSERAQKFWLHNDFVYNWSSLKQKQDDNMEYLDALADWIIEKKMNEKKNQMQTDNKSTKLKPFLDLLLDISETNNSLTKEQIREETNTIIFAGHDTISFALAMALTLLGSNTEIQDRAYQEVLKVVKSTNKSVDKEALSKLVYIEAIIKETLRLYPSVPLILRHIDKEVKLKKYTLKANTGCFISIYGTLRHEIWGPDAEVFRPERWLEKETLPDPKYYTAFGLGRRNCIGKVYAMMSMKITLAKVLQRFRIASDINKMVFKLEMTLKPVSGHYITLEERKNTNV